MRERIHLLPGFSKQTPENGAENGTENETGVVGAWEHVERVEIVAGQSVVYLFRSPNVKIPVQTNLDGWPHPTIGEKVMVRFGAQANCSLNCNFCVASLHRASQNLSAAQMVGQVMTALSDPLVDPDLVEEITVATFGLGEPLFNPNVIDALYTLRGYLPTAKFIISTTGPRHGARVFDPLLAAAREIGNVRLQISLHYMSDEDRQRFAGGALVPIAQLGEWARQWRAGTGERVYVNCGLGPLFPIWDDSHHCCLESYFGPDIAVIKLSVEGPMHPDRAWDTSSYQAELDRRSAWLAGVNYTVEHYDPSGLVSGAGCGAMILAVS